MNIKEDKDLNKEMVKQLEKGIKEAKEEGDLDKVERFEKLLNRLKEKEGFRCVSIILEIQCYTKVEKNI